MMEVRRGEKETNFKLKHMIIIMTIPFAYSTLIFYVSPCVCAIVLASLLRFIVIVTFDFQTQE